MQKMKEKESNIMKKNQEELELEQVLAEIEADERLRDVTVPERVTKNIYAQIAALEAAVADIELEESVEEPTVELSLEERFPNMTEEERVIFREALAAKKQVGTKEEQEKIGRPETEVVSMEHKRRRSGKKRKKVYILVAAVGILTMATGIVGVGTDYKWLELWDNPLGTDEMIAVESEADYIKVTEMNEKEAYAYAKEVLGAPVVTLINADDEMLFGSMQIYADAMGVDLLYTYEGTTVQYIIIQNQNKLTYFEIQTGTLQEEYVMINDGVEIAVQQYVESDGTSTFNATFTYNNLFYSMTGKLEEEKFLEILEKIFFFES